MADVMRRAVVGIGVVAALAVLQGCSSPYMQKRKNDFMQSGDWGVTISKKPYLSLHVCAIGIVSLGVARVDGQFTGFGGDQIGSQRVHLTSLGLLVWSYDEIGWGEKLDPKDPNTFMQWHIGPVGWLCYPQRAPAYTMACTHAFHFGYAGLMLNARWGEIADFLLGWTTLDIMGDDDKTPGDWSWQTADPKYKPKWTPKLPY